MDRVRVRVRVRVKFNNRKAVLTPKNDSVHETNSTFLQQIPGAARIFLSADSTLEEDILSADTSHFPVEFLNPLKNFGASFARTFSEGRRCRHSDNGLCNGTRIILTKKHTYVLESVIVTGDFIRQTVMIPRITLQPSQTPFPFTLRRWQFPVSLAFEANDY